MHRWLLLMAAVIPAALGAVGGADAQPDKSLAASLRELGPVIDPQSELGKSLPKMLAANIKALRDEVNKEDTKIWRSLKNKQDWEKFKAPRIEALKKSLGAWPEPPRDLKVHVTKTLDGEGFLIDNLVFESRPGLVVTANLYRPARPPERMPGILICHSHHNPKTEGELQDMGMTWARQGCLVLVMDQLGHGERRQHPFVDASSFPEPFKAGRQDYYFRYNVGIHLNLVGESLIGWMAWDLMRGVDLLYQKPGIDKERIILLGSVAAGGDAAAVTAALDERITAVVPFNFGGPQPETVFPLPEDAEAAFNYLGSGSWESTRNLRLSGSGGFAPWVIVASIAPRRLIYAHEFSWDREHDPVWKRLEQVYAWYGVPDHLAYTAGRGKVTGAAGPENTHCNNIGPEHRKGIYPALKKWFDMPVPDPEYRKRRPAADLQCLTPDVIKEMHPKTVHELAAALADERLAAARKERAKLEPAQRRARLAGVVDLLGPHRGFAGSSAMGLVEDLPGARVHPRWEKLQDPGGSFALPSRIIVPRDKAPEAIVICLAQEGAAGFLKHRSELLASLLQQGFAILLPDLSGTGETKPADNSRDRTGTATRLSSSRQMLGFMLLRHQLDELEFILPYVRQGQLKNKPLIFWGDSFAPVNSAKDRTAAPLDARQPAHAEPLGGLLALLAALSEKDVQGIYVRGGLSSYRSLLESPFLHVPHDAIVPGMLTVADLPDLTEALVPRHVRLEGLVDGLNRRVDEKGLRNTYAFALDAYRDAGKQGRLTLQVEPATDRELLQWFLEASKK
jgi:dienelactone hydrolase